MDTMKFNARYLGRSAFAATLLSAILSSAFAAPPADKAEAQAREAWRETITQTAVPEDGCFFATYPNTTWMKVACTTAPNRPFLPRKGGAIRNTVGNGVDDVAQVSGLLSRSVGSFATVTGVTSEMGAEGANDYSLQLNSNFMTTAACDGATPPKGKACLSWQQFVYSSAYQLAFMQYWLIDYGKCPKGWMTVQPDCYRNGNAIFAAQQDISELANLRMQGSVAGGTNGRDTLIFTTATEAYTTNGKDSLVDLSTDWNASEFNIFGDGNSSEAVFNPGSSIKVRIGVTDGTTDAPVCAGPDDGTTAETNNLNLKHCSTLGGAKPMLFFTESN